MFKKRIRKLILILVLAIILAFLIIMALKVYGDYRLKLTKVYVASHNLHQRTKIEAADLQIIEVPEAYIMDNAYRADEHIEGYYVKLNYTIPKGSPIYRDSLERGEDMADYAHILLKENEATYDFSVADIKVNPAHLQVGMLVDLYLTIDDERPLSDILLKNARIIGLYDGNNQEIADYERVVNVQTISLAVLQEDIAYLNKALLVGDLSLVVAEKTYDNQKNPYLIKDSEVFAYLD